MSIRCTLKSKILSIIFAIFLVVSLIYAVINLQVIYPKFVELEYDEAVKSMERCIRAIDNELVALEENLWEFSSWDDTYQYVQNPYDQYVESNLDGIFEFYEINLLLIINKHNEVVWRNSVGGDFEEPITLPEFEWDTIASEHTLLQFENPDVLSESYRTGILNSSAGPMLITSAPILTTEDKGPSQGTFIMAKFLTQELVTDLKTNTLTTFNLIFPDDARLSTRFAALEEMVRNHSGVYVETRENVLQVYSAYPDLESRTAFLIETVFPRSISQNGAAALRFSVALILLVTMLILLTLLYLLNRIVVNPIRDMTKFTTEYCITPDNTKRIVLENSDEIGVLADSINKLVRTIGVKTGELVTANQELEKSLKKIKTLQGIVPICANCKNIRDDKGYWNNLEIYIEQHSSASFSHWLCPECREALYAEEDWYDKSDYDVATSAIKDPKERDQEDKT